MKHIRVSSLIICMTLIFMRTNGVRADESTDDAERSRIVGVLVHTQVTAELDEIPLKAGLKLLSQAIGVTIIGRFDRPDVHTGLDPSLPITISTDKQLAIDVLEEMLAQAEEFEDCTWQIHNGFIEVGMKTRLSVPADQEVRTYDIHDLMIEPPYFQSPADPPDKQSTDPNIIHFRQAIFGQGHTDRKMPEDIAAELVEAIVEIIEPGHWDYGQQLPDPKDKPATSEPENSEDDPDLNPYTPRPRENLQDPHGKSFGPPFISKWATIRVFRGQLIVKAPDFIHRQVAGYTIPKGEMRTVTLKTASTRNIPETP
ncbi:MAG TPA: hypothetical protein VG711_01085, partial [Phycisphaerales bacterium]|nr:hypothetical protein [Phycisphaerales bacterium]